MAKLPAHARVDADTHRYNAAIHRANTVRPNDSGLLTGLAHIQALFDMPNARHLSEID